MTRTALDSTVSAIEELRCALVITVTAMDLLTGRNLDREGTGRNAITRAYPLIVVIDTQRDGQTLFNTPPFAAPQDGLATSQCMSLPYPRDSPGTGLDEERREVVR